MAWHGSCSCKGTAGPAAAGRFDPRACGRPCRKCIQHACMLAPAGRAQGVPGSPRPVDTAGCVSHRQRGGSAARARDHATRRQTGGRPCAGGSGARCACGGSGRCMVVLPWPPRSLVMPQHQRQGRATSASSCVHSWLLHAPRLLPPAQPRPPACGTAQTRACS